MAVRAKLGLGGHSFIGELGNDPQASFEEQCAIVAETLDQGIKMIDTTYYQERVALGNVLKALERRDEAHIYAWNFFKKPGEEHALVKHQFYEPHHIDIMLDELQTDRIDTIVIHTTDDKDALARELEIAEKWVEEGKAKYIALGMARLSDLEALPEDHPLTCVLAPYNIFRRETAEMFELATDMGMATIALSPFVRGWKLDEIGEDKAATADLLLRFTALDPAVDLTIVSMRKKEWVSANLAALRQGSLTPEEMAKLQGWTDRFA